MYKVYVYDDIYYKLFLIKLGSSSQNLNVNNNKNRKSQGLEGQCIETMYSGKHWHFNTLIEMLEFWETWKTYTRQKSIYKRWMACQINVNIK